MNIVTGQNVEAADIAKVVPVGAVFPFAGASAPEGYLLCDGAAVSRATYAALFAIIGEAYGAGDGSTTFNLPNLKGRVAVGRDAAQTEFDTLAETGGAKTHTLTTDEIPSHTHPIKRNTAASSYGFTYNSSGSGGDTAESNATGGGQAHNNLQPYLVLNYIIRHVTYT